MDTQDKDVAAIRATIDPWIKCCLDRDWAGLMDMCTDDILFSPPGQEKVSGADVVPWLEEFPVQTRMDFDFDRLEVDGDLAVASGSGTMTIIVDGEEVESAFDFTDAFRKTDDGTWLYSSVIFNDS